MMQLNELEGDLTMNFKAIIIDGKICFSVHKKDWKVEEVDNIYIISPKK